MKTTHVWVTAQSRFQFREKMLSVITWLQGNQCLDKKKSLLNILLTVRYRTHASSDSLHSARWVLLMNHGGGCEFALIKPVMVKESLHNVGGTALAAFTGRLFWIKPQQTATHSFFITGLSVLKSVYLLLLVLSLSSIALKSQVVC